MKVNVFDGAIFSGVLQKITRACVIIPKLSKYYKTRVHNGLDSIAKTAVEDFYGSYNERVYDRKNDLKNAYKITVTDDEWNIEVGSEFMKEKHHQENDLIYWLSMKVGVHGGFPHDGDFYWRVPTPYFTEWAISPAPYGPEDTEGRIKQESKEFIDSMYDEFGKEINGIIDDIMADLNKII